MARAIFLDRDGVINEDCADYIKSIHEWKPIPGSLEGIARLSRAGFTIAVVWNQYQSPDSASDRTGPGWIGDPLTLVGSPSLGAISAPCPVSLNSEAVRLPSAMQRSGAGRVPRDGAGSGAGC